jgi:hypothetical protein
MRLPDPERSRIVLIGTSKYEDDHLPDLPAVSRSIADLKAVLTATDFGIVPGKYCDVLIDQGDISLLGRRVRIAAKQAEDLLLVYYAGHGLTAGRRHELYLGLRNTEWDEPEFNALEYDKLRSAVLDSPARAKIIILDCCFSGRAFSHSMTVPATELIEQAEIDGSYVLASAHANELAVILPGERHTAFTGRLLGLLRNGVPGGPELLTIDDLYRQLRAIMRAEGLPQPQKRGTDTADLLALTRNRAFAKASPIRPGHRRKLPTESKHGAQRVASPTWHPKGTHQANGVRIGVLGAPASGKTTFLTTLFIAAARSNRRVHLFGADDRSTDFLVDNNAILTRQRQFPSATTEMNPLRWILAIPPLNSQNLQQPDKSAQLAIELIDLPGRRLSPSPRRQPEDDPISRLANCDGIVFLFDPVRESNYGDSYSYFAETMLTIAQSRFDENLTDETGLSQPLAVCVTKFDDPAVYAKAMTGHYCSYDSGDPLGFPYVRNDRSKDFFIDLCEQSGTGSALLPRAIEWYFSPDQTRYFITSSIGFHLSNSRGKFDHQDYRNTIPGDQQHIRGVIHPINVLEPFLWLAQALGMLAT